MSDVEDVNIAETSSYEEPEVKLEDVYEDAVLGENISSQSEEEHITIVIDFNEMNKVEQPVVVEDAPQPVVEEPQPVVEESSESVEDPAPTPVEEVTPRLVFIVPYKDREQHYKVFSAGMAAYLNSTGIPYKIFYIHQTDSRGFNRGAMKNIGFLMVKDAYPTEYKTMTIVFNDIDTMPANTTRIKYETTVGTIKHFYGFEYTLGGIVSITGTDFERLNGFPNFWAWGYEDNLLQIRAETLGIKIDRSTFFKIGHPAIVRLQESNLREVNRAEYDRFVKRTLEGINSICDLNYTVNKLTGFVDVLNFNTNAEEQLSQRKEYDLRNGPKPFQDILRKRPAPRMRMHF